MIGIIQSTIERGEDRETFKRTMAELGVDMPPSRTVETVADAEAFADEIEYPLVIRPAYSMGGTGGRSVHGLDGLRTIAARGLAASPITQILVEEPILGWEELEVEVVRDAKDQLICACFIENVGAVGVNTGESCCNPPKMTIAPRAAGQL